MKKVLMSLAVGGLFFGVTAVLAGKDVTLTGVIQAWEVDEGGNVTSVYLETDTDSIGIASSAKSRELFRYTGYLVRIKGSLAEDENGESVLTVASYEILESSEEE